MVRVVLYLFFLCILTFSGKSQENYVFSPINSNQGLSENEIHCINQLKDGRMIIVTQGLVNIYNGTSFSFLHHDDKKTYSLSGYCGYSRTYVDDETVWVKDQFKLWSYNIQKEIFISNLDSVFSERRILEPIKDFFMDSRSNSWYLTINDQLIGTNSKDERITLQIDTKINNQKDQLYDLTVIEENLYLFFKSGLMVCYDLDSEEEIYRENPWGKNQQTPYSRTLLVVPYKQYIYQIRTSDSNKGLAHRFNTKNRKWEKILQSEITLNTLTIDNKGNCWISTENGFWVTDQYLQDTKHFPLLRLVDGRIINTEIHTQYSDNNGGLWVGTKDRGLLYYHPDRYKFKTFGYPLFNKLQNQELSVYSFCEKDTLIYVGTNQGLYYYNHSKLIQNLNPELKLFNAIPDDAKCLWLFKDSSQRIWVCTDKGYGLFCIKDDKITKYSFPFSQVNFLYETFDGRFYLCSNEGFGRFDPTSGSYEPIHGKENKALKDVQQLTSYGQDQLIGLSENAIFTYNFNAQEFYISHQSDRELPMFSHSNHTCQCIFIDNRGLYWFATKDGLNIWDTDEEKLYPLHLEDGIVNNSICSILEDKQHNIWLSTANGVSRIELVLVDNEYKFSFKNFNRYDGVIEYEYLPRSAALLSDNRILLGGIGGFNVINTDKTDINQNLLPTPIFLNFLLFGEEVHRDLSYNGNVILKKSITYTKRLFLKHKQNSFTIQFSALNFVNPTQTHYRYQLVGFDEQWQEASTSDGIGRANYTNLSPGTYNLKVNATNNSGNWNKDAAQITIVIASPFWKTIWAYIVYFIIVASSVYWLSYNWRIRNLKKIESTQKEELDQLKFRFYTNISHELRTPLTLILTPINSIKRKIKDEDTRQQLEGIQRNANLLLNLVNQLLDFRKLEMKGENINLSLCDISELLNLYSLSFKELASNKNITFEWSIIQKKLYTYIDQEKFQKIINNLLSNAYKFTPEGGRIELNVDTYNEHEQSFIRIEVSDSGCGISESDYENIFKRFYQVKNKSVQDTGSGIGLHLAQEYAKLQGGIINIKSQPGTGSIFTLNLPFNMGVSAPTGEIPLPPTNDTQFLTILLVEDNEEFSKFLSVELSHHYTVLTAPNGKKGLESIAIHPPELIISDLMMPEMDGLEFCKEVKNNVKTSHIPFVLLTAKTSEKSKLQGYQIGADEYISKPFNIDILMLRIQHLIEQQQERKNLFKNAIIINAEIVTTNTVDEKLVKQALQCVEQNISNTHYTVDQFSKDMCMDRTGLYRKLMSVVGQTPTEFIRSIRLKRSIQLLEQGLLVIEVAEQIGFGSVSYFSKCFQEEFGLKPSQYLSKKR